MKNTKRALLLSLLSIVLCVAMFVGTTLAWFTDSVTSGSNKIVAGNLDVALDYSKDGTTWTPVAATTDDLFGDVTLWEPGAVSVVYLRITNQGTLALKYHLAVTATGGDFTNAAGEAKNLKDALKFAQVSGSSLTTYATREEALAAAESAPIGLGDYTQANHMAAGDVSYVSLVVAMPASVGSEFNYKIGTPAPEISLGVSIQASQFTSESDSYDEYYDLLAEPVDVYTAEAFTEAVAKVADGAVIYVGTADLDLAVAYDDAKTITLKGEKIHSLTVNIPNGTVHVYNEVGAVTGTNVDLLNSAHFYGKVGTLNAIAGHFVVEAGASAENIVAAPAAEKELKIEIKGSADIITTPAEVPEADVEIKVSGTVGEIDIPAADTNIAVKIKEGATVSELNVEGDGKIVLQNDGTLENEEEAAAKTQEIESINAEAKTLTVKDADDLRTFTKKAGNYSGYTVVLANDIDLSDKNWVPMNLWYNDCGYTLSIDGAGHKISGMKIESDEQTLGFISTTASIVLGIKDVTFENPVITSAGPGIIGVVIGGLYGDVTLENVDVTGAKLTGSVANKTIRLGGLIGQVKTGEGSVTLNMKDCDVADSEIAGFHNVGGLIGTVNNSATCLENIKAENCSVKNTALYFGSTAADALKGLAANAISNEGYKAVEFAGVKVENVTVAGKFADGAVYDVSAKEYQISTAEGLTWFSASVNGGKSFEGETVKLVADIDLAGIDWTPIGNVTSYPSISFAGVFDGQEHTISNLTCTDLTPNYACAGFFGSIMGTIKNVTLTNVNITSSHYAGGIVAYSSSFKSEVENCTVDGGTITSVPEWLGTEYDNGDKAGGIIGLNSEGGPITGCSVKNLTITGYRDIGGIAGASAGKISGNTVENVTLVQDNTNGYKSTMPDTIGKFIGRDLGATDSDNTATDVTFKVVTNEGKIADALAAAKPGDTVTLEANVTYGTITIPAGLSEITLAGTEGTTVKQISIPQGTTTSITLVNMDLAPENKDATAASLILIGDNAEAHASVTLKDCSVIVPAEDTGVTKNVALVRANNGASTYDVTVENCTFENFGRGFYLNLGTSRSLTVKNCSFHLSDGWTMQWNGTVDNVVVDGCTFDNVCGVLKGGITNLTFTNNKIIGNCNQDYSLSKKPFETTPSQSCTVSGNMVGETAETLVPVDQLPGLVNNFAK